MTPKYSKKEARLRRVEVSVNKTLTNIYIDRSFYKILASLLYWAEGGKDKSFLAFVNSDPTMIATFLRALRKGFHIDETKLRCLVHVHEYHNDPEIKKFWSQITCIPLSQFTKSYLKPHTAKRIHENYKGCIRIRYYDATIAAEVRMLYNKLPVKLGAW